MDFEKENYLRSAFISALQKLNPAAKAIWGKMNVQQMIEHFTESVMIASGKIKQPVVYEGEKLKKYREFMLSEQPFRPNTKNPLMHEEPAPLRYNTLPSAIGKLKQELIYFFEVFEKKPAWVTLNPFFGELNFEENIHLLHKHAIHHLKQFGAAPVE